MIPQCSSLFHRKNVILEVKCNILKFNSSLIKDQKYINEVKDLSRNLETKNDYNFSRQLKWEFLRHETRKFTINYTKGLAKGRKAKLRKRIKKTRN